jgi:dCMP deaminase
MNKFERDILNLRLAELQSTMGKCNRAKVGCVITRNGRVISSGYNGSVIPKEDCNTLKCDTNTKCEHSAHAEENAIAFAAKEGIPLKYSTLYVTTAPCYKCARLIVQAGIGRVVYQEIYYKNPGEPDMSGIYLLNKCNVFTDQV